MVVNRFNLYTIYIRIPSLINNHFASKMFCSNYLLKAITFVTHKLIYILIMFIGALTNVQKVWESDPVLCPNYCGRLYRGPQRNCNLRKHLKLECGVAPMFLCRICSRRFTRNENLKRHLVIVHRTIKNMK